MTEDQDPRSMIWRAIDLTKEGLYSEALPIFDEHLGALSGTFSDQRLAAAAFSFYGLCVAKVERRYSKAAECCQTSLKADRFDANHRANLAKVYLEADDRKRAIDALQDGLRIDPDHTAIHHVWNDIGRRRPPVLNFLPRQNPVNVWLGKVFRRGTDGGD